MAPLEAAPPPRNERLFDPDASIVLVGCRGAGKRTLGFIGAMHLRRRLVTEDHYFEQVTGETRGAYLRRHGGPAFARRNAEVFRQMLDANPRRCIIECGMSSLAEDAQRALRAYAATHPVVYVHRERAQILRFLDAADADQLLRADQTHRQCANLEYYNLYDASSTAGGGGGGGASAVPSRSGSGTSSPQGGSLPNGGGGGGPGTLPAADLAPTRLFSVKEDFTRFLDLLQEQPWRKQWAESPFALNALPPEFRACSYALRLRLSDLLSDAMLPWDALEARGDCVELIVDTWPDDVLDAVARQVALIRRQLQVPIIYHVEENPRGERRRPLDDRDRVDTELLELGLRLNVEYISLDLQRSDRLVRHVLARRGRSSVVGNFWFPGVAEPRWTAACHLANYERARALGCNVVRMARFCTGGGDMPLGDALLLKERVARAVPDPKPPLVVHDYSLLGVRIPLQERVLNPVKHPDLPNRRDALAAVATAAAAMRTKFRLGEFDSLRFYTIGSHIAYSITPAIHTAAFEFAGLEHTFAAAQCASLDDLRRLFLDDDGGSGGGGGGGGNRTFGGATLAAPFKVAIRPLLQLESQHAAALGAVNVLLPLRGGSSSGSGNGPVAVVDHVKARNKAGPCSAFYGDNTDWSSIYRCLQRALSPRNVVKPSRTTGLVIGAGGMARAAIYALIRLGCRHIFIYNRTPQHAHDVARHFNTWAAQQVQGGGGGGGAAAPATTNGSGTGQPAATTAAPPICHVLASTADPWPADYQPATMVVSCVPAIHTDGSPAAEFEMPGPWLTSPTGGVVVELAYEPLITPLVAQMQRIRDAPAAPAWVVVDGLEVVSEMAIEAFELLTGRIAPRRLMRSVCRQAWHEQQEQQQQQRQQRQQRLLGQPPAAAAVDNDAMTDGP